jgi:hypothetical protein
LGHLIPLIEEMADRVCTCSAGFEPIRQELRAMSVSHVWSKLPQFDASRPSFAGWVRRVLANLGRDLRKRTYTQTRHLNEWYTQRQSHCAPEPVVEAADELAQGLQAMRAALVASDWPVPAGVDYYAVLLLDVRLALWRVACPHHPAHAEASQWAAQALPWTPIETRRRPRANLPELGELWSRCTCGQVECPSQISQLLGQRLPEFPANTFFQWCSRARRRGRQLLGAEGWQQSGFASLLGTGG